VRSIQLGGDGYDGGMKDRNSPSPISSIKEIGAVVAAYRQSGLGLSRFAQEHGIPPGRLHYWVYQKPTGVRGRRPTQPTPTVAAPVFQEVKLPSRPEWGCDWAAEVGLPGGMAVRFSARASAEWIGSVVQALQGPC
jgi:hypothetical protein